ncbi:unnamed protein product [Pieris macdunnoughi]|uniref:Zinc finger protein 865 n=1 Tax=Pieris macdunnoughi TaxID=345717 RepID=A0A821YCH1_9NEOP|nr:unnamed protein product [Pieris macdunnoughi]
MATVKACRVCLEMHVKLFKMSSNTLERYYELLTGTIDVKTLGLPEYVCYVCAAQMGKFYLFRQKSLRGQTVLQGILKSRGKITEKDVRQVDKNSLILASNLSIQKAMYVSISADSTINEDVYMKLEDNQLDKLEQYNEDSYNDNDFDWPSDEENHKNKIKKEMVDVSVTVKREKEEKTDDIPLARLKKAKKSKRKKVETPKKRRGRPMHALRRNTNLPEDAVTPEDFHRYVNVVNLTIAEQMEEISKRRESKNYQNATFRCELCYKGFLDSRTWQNHNKNHVEGLVECDICKLRFKDKYIVGKHLRRHGTKYHCKQCPYVSTAVHQAKQHILWHRGVTYSCEYCEEVFTQWMSYMTHVRLKHPSDVVCGFCGFTFISKLGLHQHKSLMHRDQDEKRDIEDNTQAPYCALCDVKFASNEAYSRHMVTARKHVETNENKNGCRHCGVSFKTADELRAHVRTSHDRRPWTRTDGSKKNDSRKYPMQCPHCPQQIPNARSFFWHFRKIHPDIEYPIEKGHVCEICGKAFTKNALLSYHKLTHSGERAFKCGQCGKAFHIRRNLLLHAAVHSEQRPHVCTVCGMRFKVKTVLDRHYRVHTGEKPYQCDVCGKSFTQSNSCQLHVRTVHLKQPAPYVSRARRERQNKALAQPNQLLMPNNIVN